MEPHLIRKIGREQFDHQTLVMALSHYASPNDKISRLCKSGEIVRVKRGLYVLGEHYRRHPVSLELLANLIYGPSFISFQYALSYHGLIPERSHTVTSVCNGRSTDFDTPFGLFTYTATKHFSTGFTRITIDDTGFLIALPERALADTLKHDRNGRLDSQKEMHSLLFDNLRISEERFMLMSADALEHLAKKLRSRKTALAAKVLRKMKEQS